MKIHNCEQCSPEWHQLRLGIPTASEFHKIMTAKKRQLSTQSAGYMNTLLAEWMLGEPLEAFESPWMERGKALEAEAVRSYEFDRDCTALAVGFVTTDDGMIGASPDRLVGDVGLLEQKCPSAPVHVGHMLNMALDDDHITQVQGQLWVSEREWCDVQSYYPGLPSVIVCAQRNEEFIKDLSTCVRSFVEVMQKARETLAQRYGEFRRRRVTSEQVLEAKRAAFDAFMDSPIGGVV